VLTPVGDIEKRLFLQLKIFKMAKKNTDDTILDVQEVYGKTEAYVEKNQKTLTIIAGAIFVLFAGYFGFTRLYLFPKEKEAAEVIWKAEYYFEKDSLDLALNGDGNHFGFMQIADEYSITKYGNLANYYIGVIHMKKGEYETAIEYLKDGQLDDEITGSVAIGAIGDCYVELGDYDKGLTYFKKAAANSDNQFTAPLYMKKAATVYEEKKDYKAALKLYNSIKKDYPNSNEAKTIEKYIARAEAYAN
jgi:tetratricopeptide (TPR) repeat protein